MTESDRSQTSRGIWMTGGGVGIDNRRSEKRCEECRSWKGAK